MYMYISVYVCVYIYIYTHTYTYRSAPAKRALLIGLFRDPISRGPLEQI